MTPNAVEQAEPNPARDEVERPQTAARSALEVAEEYVRSFRDGPGLKPGSEKQLPLETEAACDRRNKGSPDRPLYSYSTWTITPREVAADQTKAAFQGQAETLRRYNPSDKDREAGGFVRSTGTGGTAPFTIDLVRDKGAGWRVDDFRFHPRTPQIRAVKSRPVWLDEVRSEVGGSLLEHYNVEEMEAKLGLKAWVFSYVGDSVRLRAHVEQIGRLKKGEKESQDHHGLELKGAPEGRACLLIYQDVRRDDPTRLNKSLVMRMSFNSQVGFDVPGLWYGWKGVRFEEQTFDGKLTPGEEIRILEVKATETGQAEGDEPRTTTMTLFATLSKPQ